MGCASGLGIARFDGVARSLSESKRLSEGLSDRASSATGSQTKAALPVTADLLAELDTLASEVLVSHANAHVSRQVLSRSRTTSRFPWLDSSAFDPARYSRYTGTKSCTLPTAAAMIASHSS